MAQDDGDMGSTDSDVPQISDLDWMSREMLKGLDENGGTADAGTIRVRLGLDAMGSINHRLSGTLEPQGLVDVMHREPENGRPQSRVFTLTPTGEEVAQMIQGVEEGDDDEGILPLDERLDRLESAMESEFGNWETDRQQEFKVTFEMMRVIRDYLAERDGADFRNYVDENFNIDDPSGE